MNKTILILALTAHSLSLFGDAARHPWSHLNFQNDPQDFRFAIVPDRAGGDCRGAFTNALKCCNLMRPEFVMTVGDLIRGHAPEQKMRAMQDELTNFVSQVKAPFFYTVGNHDVYLNINNKNPKDDSCHAMSSRVWKDYFGEETYYSFTYKGCLFLVLDTQDGRKNLENLRVGFTDKQYAWIRKTLDEHQDARWTFLFMHAPVEWTRKEWKALEQEKLASRKYTVFAGDWHVYRHYRRYGHDYYVLSVAGGCGEDRTDPAKLDGPELGQMDHITWVTMTADGPEVVNLTLDGILPGDYLTPVNYKGSCYAEDHDIPSRKSRK